MWASNSEYVEQILLIRSALLYAILSFNELGCCEFACKWFWRSVGFL